MDRNDFIAQMIAELSKQQVSTPNGSNVQGDEEESSSTPAFRQRELTVKDVYERFCFDFPDFSSCSDDEVLRLAHGVAAVPPESIIPNISFFRMDGVFLDNVAGLVHYQVRQQQKEQEEGAAASTTTTERTLRTSQLSSTLDAACSLCHTVLFKYAVGMLQCNRRQLAHLLRDDEAAEIQPPTDPESDLEFAITGIRAAAAPSSTSTSAADFPSWATLLERFEQQVVNRMDVVLQLCNIGRVHGSGGASGASGDGDASSGGLPGAVIDMLNCVVTLLKEFDETCPLQQKPASGDRETTLTEAMHAPSESPTVSPAEGENQLHDVVASLRMKLLLLMRNVFCTVIECGAGCHRSESSDRMAGTDVNSDHGARLTPASIITQFFPVVWCDVLRQAKGLDMEAEEARRKESEGMKVAAAAARAEDTTFDGAQFPNRARCFLILLMSNISSAVTKAVQKEPEGAQLLKKGTTVGATASIVGRTRNNSTTGARSIAPQLYELCTCLVTAAPSSSGVVHQTLLVEIVRILESMREYYAATEVSVRRRMAVLEEKLQDAVAAEKEGVPAVAGGKESDGDECSAGGSVTSAVVQQLTEEVAGCTAQLRMVYNGLEEVAVYASGVVGVLLECRSALGEERREVVARQQRGAIQQHVQVETNAAGQGQSGSCGAGTGSGRVQAGGGRKAKGKTVGIAPSAATLKQRAASVVPPSTAAIYSNSDAVLMKALWGSGDSSAGGAECGVVSLLGSAVVQCIAFTCASSDARDSPPEAWQSQALVSAVQVLATAVSSSSSSVTGYLNAADRALLAGSLRRDIAHAASIASTTSVASSAAAASKLPHYAGYLFIVCAEICSSPEQDGTDALHSSALEYINHYLHQHALLQLTAMPVAQSGGSSTNTAPGAVPHPAVGNADVHPDLLFAVRALVREQEQVQEVGVGVGGFDSNMLLRSVLVACNTLSTRTEGSRTAEAAAEAPPCDVNSDVRALLGWVGVVQASVEGKLKTYKSSGTGASVAASAPFTCTMAGSSGSEKQYVATTTAGGTLTRRTKAAPTGEAGGDEAMAEDARGAGISTSGSMPKPPGSGDDYVMVDHPASTAPPAPPTEDTSSGGSVKSAAATTESDKQEDAAATREARRAAAYQHYFALRALVKQLKVLLLEAQQQQAQQQEEHKKDEASSDATAPSSATTTAAGVTGSSSSRATAHPPGSKARAGSKID